MRKHLTEFLIVIGIAIGLTGCSSTETGSNDRAENKTEVTLQENVESEVESSSTQESIASESISEDTETASAQNDMSIGLRNVKIDSTDVNLDEAQQLVVKYFDTDYFNVNSPYYYEFIRRYPQVFQRSQIEAGGTIVKVLNQDAENYEIIVSIGTYKENYEYSEQLQKSWILLKGKTGEQWFMEEDEVGFRGRYIETSSVSIDGTSYTIPVVNGYDCTIYSNSDELNPGRFTYGEIKQIATTIFGDAITVREATEEEIFSVYVDTYFCPQYTVVLDNQSNAKFEKYLMDADGGVIYDLSDGYNWQTSTVRRTIEFAPDFNHFFIWSIDESLEVLTVEYYDKDFNRIWKREFESTVDAIYDYTKYNAYIIANNTLHVINMSTGEDTYEPSYVGSKKEIRKVKDGLLLFSGEKSDAIMKTTNDGKIVWTSSLSDDVVSFFGIQFIGSVGVIDEWSSSGARYISFDLTTGEILLEAESTQ